MTKQKSLTKYAVIISAILGIIQSVSWTCLAIIVIILHQSDKQCNNNFAGCMIYEYLIYHDNVDSADNNPFNLIIRPKEFIIFVYIYLALSVLWIISSSILIWELKFAKNNSKYTVVLWSVLVLFISSVDIVLMGLFAHDYEKVKDMEIATYLVGIMMSVAARGYVLLIVNIIFAVLLAKAAYRQFKKEETIRQPYIDAFDTGLTKPPWESDVPSFLYRDNQIGEDNKNFRNDNDMVPKLFSNMHAPNSQSISSNKNAYSNIAYPNNVPFSNGNQMRTNNLNQFNANRPVSFNNCLAELRNNTERPDNQPQWGRLASAQPKSSNPLPQRNRLPPNDPFIPDPDYSPHGSFKIKGVLRPNSNYNM